MMDLEKEVGAGLSVLCNRYSRTLYRAGLLVRVEEVG
jgi:hypothetical protein